MRYVLYFILLATFAAAYQPNEHDKKIARLTGIELQKQNIQGQHEKLNAEYKRLQTEENALLNALDNETTNTLEKVKVNDNAGTRTTSRFSTKANSGRSTSSTGIKARTHTETGKGNG